MNFFFKCFSIITDGITKKIITDASVLSVNSSVKIETPPAVESQFFSVDIKKKLRIYLSLEFGNKCKQRSSQGALLLKRTQCIYFSSFFWLRCRFP